jgi:hypothetical protein
MSEMRMVGLWKEVMESADKLEKDAFLEAVEFAVAQEAMRMWQLAIQGFSKQGLKRRWHPLSQVTLKLRKEKGFSGTKILQASTSMRGSVTAKKLKDRRWFVGVNRNERTKDGKQLMNIAAVHEGPFPTIIRVTPKMRRFFMAMYLQGVIDWPLSSRRKIIVIQARPFLKPAFDEVSKGTRQRIVKHIRETLAGQGVIFP